MCALLVVEGRSRHRSSSNCSSPWSLYPNSYTTNHPSQQGGYNKPHPPDCQPGRGMCRLRPPPLPAHPECPDTCLTEGCGAETERAHTRHIQTSADMHTHTVHTLCTVLIGQGELAIHTRTYTHALTDPPCHRFSLGRGSSLYTLSRNHWKDLQWRLFLSATLSLTSP